MPKTLKCEITLRPRWRLLKVAALFLRLLRAIGMRKTSTGFRDVAVKIVLWHRIWLDGWPAWSWHKSRWGKPWIEWAKAKRRPKGGV